MEEDNAINSPPPARSLSPTLLEDDAEDAYEPDKVYRGVMPARMGDIGSALTAAQLRETLPLLPKAPRPSSSSENVPPDASENAAGVADSSVGSTPAALQFPWSTFPVHPAVDILFQNFAAKKLVKPQTHPPLSTLKWRQSVVKRLVDILRNDLQIPCALTISSDSARIESRLLKHFRLVEVAIDFFDGDDAEGQKQDDLGPACCFLDMTRLRGDAVAYAYTVSRLHYFLSQSKESQKVATKRKMEDEDYELPRLEDRGAVDVEFFIECLKGGVREGTLPAGEEVASYLALWLEEATNEEMRLLATAPDSAAILTILLGARADALGILHPTYSALSLLVSAECQDNAAATCATAGTFQENIATLFREVIPRFFESFGRQLAKGLKESKDEDAALLIAAASQFLLKYIQKGHVVPIRAKKELAGGLSRYITSRHVSEDDGEACSIAPSTAQDLKVLLEEGLKLSPCNISQHLQ